MTDKIPFKNDSIYFQYNVSDFDKAKAFYKDIFGFELSWDGGAEVGWCEFNLPVQGAKLGLNLQKERDFSNDSGVLTFDVTNLDSTKSYLEGKEVKTSDIVDIPDMVSYFNCWDTEGNRIQFVAEPRVKN
jgi:predicted enzyme related to lactoylglutathione lyase